MSQRDPRGVYFHSTERKVPNALKESLLDGEWKLIYRTSNETKRKLPIKRNAFSTAHNYILDACKEFEIYIKSTLLTADSSVFKPICELGLKNVHKSSNNKTLTI